MDECQKGKGVSAGVLRTTSMRRTDRSTRVRLPESDRPILAARGVHLAVGAVLDAPDGSVVALVALALGPRLEVVHPHPGVRGGPDDKAVSEEWVEGGRRRSVGERDGQRRVAPGSITKVSQSDPDPERKGEMQRARTEQCQGRRPSCPT